MRQLLTRPLLRPLYPLPRLLQPSSLLRQTIRQPTLRSNLRQPIRRYTAHAPNGRAPPGVPGSPTPPEPPKGFSARLKQLSKDYGYAAVGVYFGLSVLDFPFCFIAVRLLGTERVGEYEHAVVSWVKDLAGWESTKAEEEEEEKVRKEMEEERKKEASIWTELVFAYAVHKSLMPLRIPLAAAVLPKVVKVLRSWGWKVGRKAV